MREIADSPRRVMVPISIGSAALFGAIHELLPPEGQPWAKAAGVLSATFNLAVFMANKPSAIVETISQETPASADVIDSAA